MSIIPGSQPTNLKNNFLSNNINYKKRYIFVLLDNLLNEYSKSNNSKDGVEQNNERIKTLFEKCIRYSLLKCQLRAKFTHHNKHSRSYSTKYMYH